MDYKKINNSDLQTILSFVGNEPIFFDNKKLLSIEEINNYNSELNISRQNIIPLIDLYDNEFLIYDINNDNFKILDISDDFERDIDSLQEYIDMLKNKINKNILQCPICKEKLMFMMPDGTILYCKNCNKNFKNNNGSVGEETTSPYTDSTALY